MNVSRNLKRGGLLLILLPLMAWGLLWGGEGEAGLRRVDPSHTCMGSNQAQEKGQNYAEVEGRRYYGCTEMCIVNLKQNPGFRYGVDPASGRRVDKAKAVIAARSNGELLYFESEESFRGYRE